MLQKFYVTNPIVDTREFLKMTTFDNDQAIEAAKIHTLTEHVFNLMLQYQYGPNLPAGVGTVMTIAEVEQKLGESDNDDEYMELSWTGATHAIELEKKAGEPMPGFSDVDYSTLMFRGIIAWEGAALHSFRFYKAMDRKGKDTVIFETLNAVGGTLHYYDVSNDHP